MAYALTKGQTQELESIQKRAIHIIFHFTRGMPYSYMLAATNFTSLSSRRDDLYRIFFLSITNPASCLHHLLPPPRSNAVTSRLRSYEFFYPRLSALQIDTVPSCNMAFLTTRTGLPTVNIHPSYLHMLAISIINSYYYYFYYYYSTRPTSIHNFYHFLLIVLNQTEL